jgi:hypothetical protein
VFTSAILARGRSGGNRGLAAEARAVQETGQIPVDLPEPRLSATLTSHQDQLVSLGNQAPLAQTVRFAEEALGAVAAHRVAHPAAGDETGSKRAIGYAQNEEDQEPTREGPSIAIDALEFRIDPEPVSRAEPPVRGSPRNPVGGHYGASRALPLARRRFKISRPALDFIRARKPCFFLRLRLCGWKVRFTLIPF